MAMIDRRFLSTKVARRLLVLFLLCTLVPLVVSTVLAYRHVTRQLVAQHEVQMLDAARAAGMSVMERLMAAESDLRRFEESRGAPVLADLPSATRLLTGLARTTGAAAPAWTVGSLQLPLPDLGPQGQAFVTRGGTYLVARPHLAPLLVLRASDGSLLWGEIRSEALWSAAEIYAGSDGGGTLCVHDAAGFALTCPEPLLTGVDGEAGRPTVRSLGVDGEELRVASAPLYLLMQFGADAWRVSVATPASEALGPVRGFTRVFIPSIFLVLWTAMLLVNVQVRRTMVPLERLREGTMRVSRGDFDTQVDVRTDDEFRDLADSFNSMSGQLGRQFRTLEAIHELDQVALQAPAIEDLLASVRGPLSHAVPDTDLRILLLLDEQHILLLPEGVGGWRTVDVDVPLATQDLLGDREYLRVSPSDHPELAAILRVSEPTHQGEVFPLLVGGQVAGALVAVGCRDTELTREQQNQLRPLADQIALGAASVRRQQQLTALKEGALNALALTIDASSRWTAGHSDRVTELSVRIASAMGLSQDDLTLLRESALLHDIGKIGVPSAILNKPDRLERDEYEVIKSHVTLGVEILSPIEAFAPMLPVVRHHHERYDGKGYPDGLAGDDIPLMARIVAVADTFDAMVSDRPYRRGMDPRHACAVIESEAGRQLDPAAVAAFLQIYTTDLPAMLESFRTNDGPALSLAGID